MNEQTKLSFSGRCLNWRPLPLLQAIFVLAGLLLAASTAQAAVTWESTAQNVAQDQENTGESWGEWKSLGSAYIARRRQPTKLDLPKAERRQANVQARVKKSSGVQIQPNRQTFTQSYSENMSIAKSGSKSAKKKASSSISGLWIYTSEEGLYEIPIADLATAFNKSQNSLRNKARQGKLNLTTAKNLKSQTAAQAVSWHYDSSTESILFVAQAYDTFYSDENAYKLTLSGSNAEPMEIANGSGAPGFGDENFFRDKLEFEEEPDMLYSTWTVAAEPDADYWFWDYLYGGTKDEINVELVIPDPTPSGKAVMRVTMRGWTDLLEGNEHEVSAEINSQPVGTSVVWDAFDEAVLVVKFKQNLLEANGNNILTLRNTYAAGTNPGQWLDKVSINYQRKPVALNDRLWLHNVAAGPQAVTGFTEDDIVVVESPDGAAILRQDITVEPDGLGGWQVLFEADDGKDYLVTARSASAVAGIGFDNMANLRARNNRANYLIIAPRDFEGTAEKLAAYRSARYKDVKIVWLDDIYNEFSAGRSDPAAIGRFMNHVIDKWKTVPDSVVLLGKGSLDERDRMKYADSFVPVIMTTTPWALAASDSKLLGFEVDAPFAIGRLPITNDNEGLQYLKKLKRFEKHSPGSQSYEAVLAADNPDSAGQFHANSDLMATRLLDTLGFDLVTLLYHPDDDVRLSLIDSVTWETGYVSYDGHGSTTQVGNTQTENFLKATDAALLENRFYPVFSALTCAVGDDTLPGTRSLVGALVLNPNGGAIASVAPTGLSIDADAQLLANAFIDSFFGEGETIGGALLNAKAATSGNISAFMPKMYSVIGEPEVYTR